MADSNPQDQSTLPAAQPPIPNATFAATEPLPPVENAPAPPPNVSSSELAVGPKSPNLFLPILLVVLLLLGGVGAFMYFSKPAPEPVAVPEVPEVKPAALFLNITSPEAEVTAANGEVLVAGKTLPNTPLLIYSDVDETSTDSDNSGNFEETVVVGETGGLIRVIAFGENGDEKSETVQVAETKPISSGQSGVLGEKESSPGQVKKANAALGESDTVNDTNPGQPTKKPNPSGNVKTSDLTVNPTPDAKTKKLISDFLAVKTPGPKAAKVGATKLKTAQEGTGSAELRGLKLKKLVASTATPGATLKRHALHGVVIGVADGVLSIAHQIQRDRTFTVYYNAATVVTGKGLVSPTGASIEVGMRIAAVGEPAADGVLAKRIHVIPGLATGILEKNPISSPSSTTKPTPSASVSGTPAVTPTEELSPTPTEESTPTPTGNATP